MEVGCQMVLGVGQRTTPEEAFCYERDLGEEAFLVPSFVTKSAEDKDCVMNKGVGKSFACRQLIIKASK